MLYQNCNEIGEILSEILGHEQTNTYIFIYIDELHYNFKIKNKLN
jgi:hypothetical protein